MAHGVLRGLLPKGAKAEKTRIKIEKLREAKAEAWKRVLVAACASTVFFSLFFFNVTRESYSWRARRMAALKPGDREAVKNALRRLGSHHLRSCIAVCLLHAFSTCIMKASDVYRWPTATFHAQLCDLLGLPVLLTRRIAVCRHGADGPRTASQGFCRRAP